MQDIHLITNGQSFPALSRYQRGEQLEVILKISERCNIDCTYCYFFHGGDNSFRLHPASMPGETIDAVCTFVREGVSALAFKETQIIFHGGEPLLLGKSRFAKLCEQLMAALAPFTRLTFNIQTNATLIDQAWIELFEKYYVTFGVSMDGLAEYHDVARIDFKSRGRFCEAMRQYVVPASTAQSDPSATRRLFWSIVKGNPFSSKWMATCA